MVFCCIAMVGIAIIYFIALWIRQIFFWAKPDRSVSNLPIPPRALTGNGALPVYGHTRFFRDKAGDMALDFDPKQLSLRWFWHIPGWNRPLGKCFSVFIWGQWRVAVQGTAAAKKILDSQELEDSWPWTPPVTLLGQSCFGLLQETEREVLRRLIGRSLSHKQVQMYAIQFAHFAEKCLDEITTGQFKKDYRKQEKRRQKQKEMQQRKSMQQRKKVTKQDNNNTSGYNMGQFDDSSNHDLEMAEVDLLYEDDDNTFAAGPAGERLYKVKWQALRSYTFDIVDGPVLNTKLWTTENKKSVYRMNAFNASLKVKDDNHNHNNHFDQSETTAHEDGPLIAEINMKKPSSTKTINLTSKTTLPPEPEQRTVSLPQDAKKPGKKNQTPSREQMLRWMERMKNGIDTIKTTFGPEWMYIWMLNEYGRALNARMKLEHVVQAHVSKLASTIPNITHLEGHVIHDVTTQPIPLLAMRDNQLRHGEGIMGDAHIKPDFGSPRPRSQSAPNLKGKAGGTDESSDDDIIFVDSFDQADVNKEEQEMMMKQQQQMEVDATAMLALDLEMPPERETELTALPGGTTSTSTDSSGADGLVRDKPHRSRIESCPGLSPTGRDGLFNGTGMVSIRGTGRVVSSLAFRPSMRKNLNQFDLESATKTHPVGITQPPADKQEIRGMAKEGGEIVDTDDPLLIGCVVCTTPSEVHGSTASAYGNVPEFNASPSASPTGQRRVVAQGKLAINATGPLPSLSDSSSVDVPCCNQSASRQQPQSQLNRAATPNQGLPRMIAPGAAAYHATADTDDDLTAPTTDGDDAASINSASGDSKLSGSQPRRSIGNTSSPGSRIPNTAPSTPGQNRRSLAASRNRSLLGPESHDDDDDDDDDADRGSLPFVLPESLRQTQIQQTPPRPHLDSAVSTASTVQMTPTRPNQDLDDISTTSTMKMLEEMDNSRKVADGGSLASLPYEPTFSSVEFPPEAVAKGAKNDTQQQTTNPLGLDRNSSETNSPLSGAPTSPILPQSSDSAALHLKTPETTGNDATSNADGFSDAPKQTVVMPVLERIMRQHDLAGNGISQAVATELSLILWMMMEVGNAWTSMALSLLSTDRAACILVQEELDSLDFLNASLYTPHVLNQMKYMDALIYEAIRLCPANLGGMMKTTQTVEMEDEGVQIPKGTNIFFCKPTDSTFDIRAAVGKKPENLGRKYPCVELHGFLPLHGLEVPLMVLQSKVFLIALLQKFTPVLSLRKNFIRRVQNKVQRSFSQMRNRSNPNLPDLELSTHSLGGGTAGMSSGIFNIDQQHPAGDLPDVEACPPRGDVSEIEAMSMFTKTPFPEPRRVIHLRPRSLD